jgi:site-specific DNA recombinase
MKRAIIYSRVSTDEQKKNNSPSAQRDDGMNYAQEHGFTVLDVLTEDYTGTTIDRPTFNRLLELADASLIEVVIVQHPDRLGRGPILEMAIALLAKRGIEVYACNRGLISDEDDENAQIQNSVDGLVSGVERRNIKRRTQRGIVQKVTEGKMHGCGGAPFGYRWEGRGAKRTLVIHEEEAKILTLIFELYDSGVSVLDICKKLEAMGVPSPSALPGSPRNGVYRKQSDTCRWVRSVIHRILRRRTYIGEYVAFKKEGWRHNNQGVKPILNESVTFAVPAIISTELFESVQLRRTSNRNYSKRNNSKYFYLLRCLLRCHCGYRMSGSSRGRYYRCCAADHKHDILKPCDSKMYQASDVDYTVWRWIEENVLGEDNLRMGIERKRERSTDERERLLERFAYFNERLDAIDKEAERLKLLFTSGLYKLEEITKDKRRLDMNGAELDKERAVIEQQLAALGVSADRERRILDAVREMKEKVNVLTNEGRREIVELLETSVQLYRKDEQPWAHIEVRLTEQIDDVPIASPQAWVVQPGVSSFG